MKWRSFVTWLACCVQAAGQVGSEPEGLLQRIKDHVGQGLRNLPNYTCLQTIERFERAQKGKEFFLVDRLKLEVAFVEGKEFFAWPGESKFEVSKITELVPLGTIGNGSFALHAYSVFLTSVPNYRYRGEEVVSGRRLIRYDYWVPRQASGYTLRVGGRQDIVGYHGSFIVDAGTLDLVRLEVIAEDIPSHLGVAEATHTIDYSPIRIGGRIFSLPSRAELILILADGSAGRNVIAFSGCRLYTGESVLRFDDVLAADDRRTSEKEQELEWPPSTTIEISLETPVDLRRGAVGDLVIARVVSAVKRKGTVLVPKDSRVFGRVVRLTRRQQPVAHYEVGLRFFHLEAGKRRGEFNAYLEAVLTAGGVSTVQGGMVRFPYGAGRRSAIVLQESDLGAGTALMLVAGEMHELPKGLRMVWRTAENKEDKAR